MTKLTNIYSTEETFMKGQPRVTSPLQDRLIRSESPLPQMITVGVQASDFAIQFVEKAEECRLSLG